jgi:tetratricopeptide (TPR) repeat protein
MDSSLRIIIDHWFEILLALALIVSVLRILVSTWLNPQAAGRTFKTLFSGVWADIRVTVLIFTIAVAAGLGFIVKRLDTPFAALLWAAGLLSLGWLVGFLFGIPKVLQGDTTLAQAQINPPPPTGAPAANPQELPNGAASSAIRRSQYLVNTNLEQISDWLTKIIVGLGLINLKQVPELVMRLSNFMAPVMGADSNVFAAAVFLYFSVIGFLGGYITTRLWLAGAFYRADSMIGLQNISEEQRSAVMRESPDLENPKLSPAADAAAKQIVGQSLDQLSTREDITIWARAQLSQANYESAVAGYAKAVALSPDDIKLRLEYATALFYAKSHITQVRDQLMAAYNLMKAAQNVSQDVKRKVYRSITYHFLFQPPPEGFSKAIQFGEEYINDPANQPVVSGAIWVNLASAYGQKFRWLIENRESITDATTQLQQTRDAALNAVRKALEIDPSWKQKLTELLVKNQPGKDPNENDLEVFENDNDFRTALGLTAV